MTRRQFLEIAAAGAAAAACNAPAHEREPDPATCLASPHLLNVLRDDTLTGWGWEHADSVANMNNIVLKPRAK